MLFKLAVTVTEISDDYVTLLQFRSILCRSSMRVRFTVLQTAFAATEFTTLQRNRNVHIIIAIEMYILLLVLLLLSVSQ